MSLDNSYEASFAGVPFLVDTAAVVRLPTQTPSSENLEVLPPRKQQPLADLVDELNRLISFKWLTDFGPSRPPGRNLDALARELPTSPWPNSTVPIGNFFYPNAASRWSVYRGLVTSSMAKAMLAATGGTQAKPFVLKAVPVLPGVMDASQYKLETDLYMLPPRPLAEHGNQFDGLYLITLVDERYYWQNTPITLRIDNSTTWNSLIAQLADSLNVTIRPPLVDTAYSKPEADSQLWVNAENAPALLDAIALSVGRVVVRSFDGSYDLFSPTDSAALVESSRGNAGKVIRYAGGDMFTSGTKLKAGNLTKAKNAVVPSAITVTFPKYVIGDDPVPHFVNPRYANQRPSAWFEDSYGDVYGVNVPIQSGGPLVSGLSGTSTTTIHSTAKALCSGEAQAASGVNPINRSGLTSLAMQVAEDYYNGQIIAALDEVYPGTFAWTPEGIHDVVWVFSERVHQASTRIMRAEWNTVPSEMQHTAHALSGYSTTVKGVGGPSVAQTIRDSTSGTIVTTVSSFNSTDTTLTISSPDYLPTQNRWKGQVGNEIILFEGTSGGTSLKVVNRGIDGTLAINHPAGGTILLVQPDTTYGVNLVTHEKGQFVFPADWTSGGIQGVHVVPQTQTVRVLCNTPATLNGAYFYSGAVNLYDAQQTSGSEYQKQENVWISERNANPVTSGRYYDGQLVGFSALPARPIYAVNQNALSTTCSAGVFLSENDVRCESGQLNVYQRPVYLNISGGCLYRSYGDYVLNRTEGCCGCSGYPRSGDLSSGGFTSGTPLSGCYVGNCSGGCATSPFQWVLPLEGFRGNCEVFNRNWTLPYSPGTPCVWKNQYTANSLTATVELDLLSGGAARISFTYGNASGLLHSATYSGSVMSGDCCSPLLLVDAVCGCDDVAASGTDCSFCTDVIPETWSTYTTGFTGDFASFNGNWNLPPSGACTWQQVIGTVTVTLLIFDNEWRWKFRDSSASPSIAVDYVQVFPPSDCASTQGMYLASIHGTGTTPYLITIIPTASDQGPSSCPRYFYALPYCCSGATTSGGGPAVSSPCCSGYSLLTRYYLTFHNGTGACICLNGNSIPLDYNGSTWDSNGFTGCSGFASTMRLECLVGTSGYQWTLLDGLNTCWNFGTNPIDVPVCSPLGMSFAISGEFASCCGSGQSSMLATISE